VRFDAQAMESSAPGVPDAEGLHANLHAMWQGVPAEPGTPGISGLPGTSMCNKARATLLCTRQGHSVQRWIEAMIINLCVRSDHVNVFF
jgi:hypothetical protein